MTNIEKAEQILCDNGIEKDEVQTVLQALGYALMDKELYPENPTPTVTFGATWSVYGKVTIPLPETVDPHDEDAVRDFIESEYPNIPLSDFDSDFISDSDSIDYDSNITVFDGRKKIMY